MQPNPHVWLQVLSDPRQKRFFKAKDMRDLFTLGDEYANATETSEIFASVNSELTATLAAEQALIPEFNHLDGELLLDRLVGCSCCPSGMLLWLAYACARGGGNH